VQLIAKHPLVNGEKYLGEGSPAEVTEHLYQHFYSTYYASLAATHSGIVPPAERLSRQCKAKWKDIVRTCLYATLVRNANGLPVYGDHNVPVTLSDADRQAIESRLTTQIPQHPYLSTIIPLIREAACTITYNFDDILERLIASSLTPRERTIEGRGYETFVTPTAQGRRRNARIYHPNGFLPLSKLESSSDAIALTETDLVGQVLPKHELESTFLRAHIRTHTTLLLGMSFSDFTQKTLYQENREHFPGNVHYLIQRLGTADAPEQRAAARNDARNRAQTNFKAFGVLSVPLFADEYSAFFRLLTIDEEYLVDLASEHDVALVYRYYLVGPPGSGKSSILAHLGCLVTHDEWPDTRPDLLARAPESLSEPENRIVNAWLNRQFRLKNRRLLRAEIGIHVVDRSPLDPLTYQDTISKQRQRATDLRRGLRSPVAAGHVIRFIGPADVLALRLILLQKDLEPDVIGRIATRTDLLYQGEGVTTIDTTNRTLLDVAKEVSDLIHLRDVTVQDLDGMLARACEESELSENTP
jgi:energy-coupling factor transporter ATP-binding protein EcfA2